MARGIYIGGKIVWSTIPEINLLTGTAESIDLSAYLYNPRNREVAFSSVGSLPTGCSISGNYLNWNGNGTAAATSVTIRAESNQYESDASLVVEIVSGNAAPEWSQYIGPFNVVASSAPGTVVATMSDYVTDPEDDPLTITMNGSLPSGLSYNSTTTEVTVSGALSVGDSASVTFSADDGVDDAESDWQARISGAGVVWYHNFESDAEVNMFRYQNDAGILNDVGNLGNGNCRHVADGFAGGGCLELNVPTGDFCNVVWLRPFSPIVGGTTSGNGRGVGNDDPGAGVLTAQAWTPTQGYNYTPRWKKGYYAHADHWANASRGTGAGYEFNGNEFYIQWRMKIQSTAWASGNPEGKLGALFVTGQQGTNQIVTPNSELAFAKRDNRRIVWYTNFGRGTNSHLYEGHPEQTGSRQPALINTRSGLPCTAGTDDGGTCATCVCYPVDEWFTALLHFKMGPVRLTTEDPPPGDFTDPYYASSLLEFGIALAGETNYTYVYSKDDYVWNCGDGVGANSAYTGIGHNAFMPWAYMNAGSTPVPAVVGWYQRYTQMIFSHSYIAPPAA